jgi:hypothetical protein
MREEDRKNPTAGMEEGDQGLPLSSETERAAMIASVLRDQAEREEVRETAPVPGPKPLLPQILWLAVSVVLSLYVWLGSPAWLSPEPIPLPSVEVEEATLRLQIFLQAQALERYRRDNGRIPAFLEEAGPPRPGIEYRRLDGQSYLLRGVGERVNLTYMSRDSLPGFLGPGGEAILLGGGGP